MQSTIQSPMLPRRTDTFPTKARTWLGSSLDNIELARRWTRQNTGFGPIQANHLELVVSELMNNALQHTTSGLPGGTVLVQIEHTCLYVVLSVTDNGPLQGKTPSYPQTQPLCPDWPSGRGLYLVNASVTSWDWERTANGGTVVHTYFEQ